MSESTYLTMILSYEISLNEDEDYLVKTLNDNYFYFILPLRNTSVHFYTTNITFRLIIIPSILLLYNLFFLFIYIYFRSYGEPCCVACFAGLSAPLLIYYYYLFVLFYFYTLKIVQIFPKNLIRLSLMKNNFFSNFFINFLRCLFS